MALWNPNVTYLQVAYQFAQYFVETYNQNPHNLASVCTENTMLSHNGVEIMGGAEVLNYLALFNLRNIEIPANGIDIQPSFNGSILINLFGTYQQTGIFSGSGTLRNIILTLLIIPDGYGNYYLLNLIIKTKDRGQSFTSLRF